MTYKFMYPPPLPANWCDTSGLYYRSYSVYSGGNGSPDPASLVSGSLTTTSGAMTQINASSLDASTTRVWRGYFNPDATSSTWEFRVTSDDGSYLWIDTDAEGAVASLATGSAIVDNSGVHTSQTVTSTTLSLDSQYHYALTLIAGNNTGDGEVTLEWRRDGGAWVSDGASRLCYDTRYVDGFGADTYTASASPSVPTVWGIAGADGAVGYASGSDLTSWTGYRSPADASANDHYTLTYGKDGSGNGRWVKTLDNNNYQIMYSNTADLAGGASAWTNASGISGDRYSVGWGNNKWIASSVGTNNLLTSSDGATWGALDISGLTGITTSAIYGTRADGAGNWIFCQQDRIYASTNDGDSWFLLNDFNDSSIIYDAGYSNGYWYALRTNVGGTSVEVISRASSANSSSWSDSADLEMSINLRDMAVAVSTGSASESTVITMIGTTICRSVDSGQNFTKSAVLPYADPKAIATDGEGNWVITHNAGQISYSTDDGTTWSSGANGLDFPTNTENITAVASNKTLPL